MALPATLQGRLALPVIAAPMFLISNPDLVIAECKAGIVGAFPALNARPIELLDAWLTRLTTELGPDDAPFAVNLIVHKSNTRLEQDLALCVKHRVPVVITSLGARADVNDTIHSYGGIVLHDVTNTAHARKAVEKGADGLILVAAGAGGHAGTWSPFALVQEVRQWFSGPIALSGAIATGDAILAAQAMGADLAYIGSAFIATDEAQADQGYKDMIVDSSADDIVYTSYFTGIRGNYLKPSIRAAGLDPDALPDADPSKMDFAKATESGAKAWRDIWGCGQGIGAIHDVVPAAARVALLAQQYRAARDRLGLN